MAWGSLSKGSRGQRDRIAAALFFARKKRKARSVGELKWKMFALDGFTDATFHGYMAGNNASAASITQWRFSNVNADGVSITAQLAALVNKTIVLYNQVGDGTLTVTLSSLGTSKAGFTTFNATVEADGTADLDNIFIGVVQ